MSKTITVEPILENIQRIPQDVRDKWIEALQTSEKLKSQLRGDDFDGPMCCLGTLLKAVGVPEDDPDWQIQRESFKIWAGGITKELEKRFSLLKSDDPQGIDALAVAKVGDMLFSFIDLNDGYLVGTYEYELTHKEIGEILKGNSIEIELEESDDA